MEAIQKHNIPAYANAEVNVQSLAEHTLMLVWAALKKRCFKLMLRQMPEYGRNNKLE